MIRWFVASVFWVLLGLHASVFAKTDVPQDVSASRVVVVGIHGHISKKVLETVQQNISKVQGDPVPAGLIVLLDSPGGDGIAAMNIGRLLRKAQAHVFVTGQCASACIFVLASGVIRGAPAYSVGIHRGRITISDANAKILEEVDVSKNSAAQKMLQGFEGSAAKYFTEMGMAPELFYTMQNHQSKGVYRLNSRQLTLFGLSGFESRYFEERVAFYEIHKRPYQMDRDELARRTAKVASRCAEFDKKHEAFIDCYKLVLRDPYLN